MCLRQYTIGVCPYCPNTRAFLAPGKLYNNEHMIHKQTERCRNFLNRRPCHEDPALRDISMIWLCNRNKKGRDKRIPDACLSHAVEFEDSRRRDLRTHKKAMADFRRRNAKKDKHPQVFHRIAYGKEETLPLVIERRLDYDALRLLGYERKADLEYDDPRDLEIALEEDRRHEQMLKVEARQRIINVGCRGSQPPPYSEVADSEGRAVTSSSSLA